MKKMTATTETYRMNKDFRIDIVDRRGEFEAWIYRKNSGYKVLMYGSPKKQNWGTVTKEYFINMVENTWRGYANGYDEDMDTIDAAYTAKFYAEAE